MGMDKGVCKAEWCEVVEWSACCPDEVNSEGGWWGAKGKCEPICIDNGDWDGPSECCCCCCWTCWGWWWVIDGDEHEDTEVGPTPVGGNDDKPNGSEEDDEDDWCCCNDWFGLSVRVGLGPVKGGNWSNDEPFELVNSKEDDSCIVKPDDGLGVEKGREWLLPPGLPIPVDGLAGAIDVKPFNEFNWDWLCWLFVSQPVPRVKEFDVFPLVCIELPEVDEQSPCFGLFLRHLARAFWNQTLKSNDNSKKIKLLKTWKIFFYQNLFTFVKSEKKTNFKSLQSNFNYFNWCNILTPVRFKLFSIDEA